MKFDWRYGATVICAAWSIAVTLCGCEPPPPPAAVQRLVHQQLGALSEKKPAPPPKLDAAWSVKKARAAENNAQGLTVTWGGEPAVLTLGGKIRAEDYSAFIVRMRIDPGRYPRQVGTSPQAFFQWRTPLEPNVRPETDVSLPVFADNTYHTYQIPLWFSTGTPWVGEITEIEFIPCSIAADIHIERMELLNEPATTPARITVNYETHEALYGSQSWRVRVPPNAVFETYVGMSPLSWLRVNSDGVEFSVTIERGRSEPVEVAREKFDPVHAEGDRTWRRVQADLSEYAGMELTIRLAMDHLEDMRGDYGFWGSPAIFQRGGAETDIPVILISNDTLRADHLGCYGYERDTSPHLDAFRKDAILFENAVCPVSWTLPSHMTMFTGMYPKNHKVSHTVNLSENIETIAERLAGEGYITAAYAGVNGYLLTNYGFCHGFDVYNTPPEVRLIEETQVLVMDWLDHHKRDKIHLFFHNFDIHGKPPRPDATTNFQKLPYYPPTEADLFFATTMPVPPLLRFESSSGPTGADILNLNNFSQFKIDEPTTKYIKALYDDGIRYVDRNLGAFFEDLKSRGIYDRALIIVTADHGEEFGEHGKFSHWQIYEGCHHIPMLVKLPRNELEGASFKPVVQLTDIYPTVLDVLGLEARQPTDGQSLVALVRGEITPFNKGYGERFKQQALRTDAWSFVHDPEKRSKRLFDLSVDPKALTEATKDKAEVFAAMQEDLSTFYRAEQAGWNIECQANPSHGPFILQVTALLEQPAAVVDIVDSEGEPNRNFDQYEVINDGKEVKASIVFMDYDRDILVIRPTGGADRLRLAIKTSRLLDIAIGDQPVRRGVGLEGLFDLNESKFPKPPEMAIQSLEIPRVRIWWEEPSGDLPAAQTLTQEQKDQLEALGYLPE